MQCVEALKTRNGLEVGDLTVAEMERFNLRKLREDRKVIKFFWMVGQRQGLGGGQMGVKLVTVEGFKPVQETTFRVMRWASDEGALHCLRKKESAA